MSCSQMVTVFEVIFGSVNMVMGIKKEFETMITFLKSKYCRTFIIMVLTLRVIGENVYLKKYGTNKVSVPLF